MTHPSALLLCAGTLLALAPAVQAAEAVVVASTAPGYALGQVVADGAAVTVPEGAGIMLLFANGRTLRIKGPFAGPSDRLAAGADGGDPNAPARPSLGGLLGGERFAQADVGAARAFGAPLNRAAERAFAIDPGVPGTYCLPVGTRPTLIRPQDGGLSGLTLSGDGSTATVTWSGTEGQQPWPEALPLRDGLEVRVSGPDDTPRHSLHLRLLDPAPAKDAAPGAALALRLAAAGCGRQTAALLRPLRDALVPLDLYLAAEQPPAAGYRPGDRIRLVLQANRDAHVYCYLRNGRGQLLPLFPLGTGTSARVAADTALTLPGDRMPLPLVAGESGGDMEVRCVAADRDLGDALPGRADAFRPMDAETVAQLDRALNALHDTDAVVAQVILRVR
ncbi:DUF4384 domain-containing protein [Azospirillum sp. TSO35-2]|uniref:DUF4384 domain-containing protein n=1 Tax=Azospirillum sp. TSO35-2 TaxID=716796 RepID=UPI000D617697|nr:DUF4384 domain-containing protein [Azospirillum sp. TSO35-2]PWC37779.1 hypothetical protein TSO352_09875 [Azospirillum sp. TSO35-2]